MTEQQIIDEGNFNIEIFMGGLHDGRKYFLRADGFRIVHGEGYRMNYEILESRINNITNG